MNIFNLTKPSIIDPIVFATIAPPTNMAGFKAWIECILAESIQRVVCLLPPDQLQDFSSLPGGLLVQLHEQFGEANVCWAPIKELHYADLSTLRCILDFLEDSALRKQKVVVHCLAGLGRTGHVLAAWLVSHHGLSIQDAIAKMIALGRDPWEAVAYGNARQEDLEKLLAHFLK
ncbi:MAG: dual specificity protein phosphatase family protein [Nitrospirota bacterium]|nr:dual specificity protein phosphatase family protein [Nitrospirota bacterium]